MTTRPVGSTLHAQATRICRGTAPATPRTACTRLEDWFLRAVEQRATLEFLELHGRIDGKVKIKKEEEEKENKKEKKEEKEEEKEKKKESEEYQEVAA